MTGVVTTKIGDRGLTTFIKDIKISKASPIMDALGDLDELNAVLGLEGRRDFLRIQNFIVEISGYIIYSNTKTAIVDKEIKYLEDEIDKYKKITSIPEEFIIPTGYIHLARTVCRRAERSLVKLNENYYDREDIFPCMKYINRLSDYLFIYSIHKNDAKLI